MKNLIFLMFISLSLFVSCSAKNTAAVNNPGQNGASASQSATGDSVIKGSLDKNGKVVITDMNYKKGSDQIPQDSENTVKELADYLKNNTSVTMNVACYTNEDGSPEYCVDLSQKRAKKLYEELRKHGVDEKRINLKGEGWNPGDAEEEQGERMEIELIH